MTYPCPHCGVTLTQHTDVTGNGGPGEGDISICFMCRCISIVAMGNDLYLRKPSEEELARIMANPGVTEALNALATHRTAESAAQAFRRGQGG